MSRLCTVCSHPQRVAIDAALVAHRHSYRKIAIEFGLVEASVYRHAMGHLPQALEEAKVKLDAESLARRIGALNGYVSRVLKRGEKAGDDKLVLLAVGEGRRNIDSMAKLGVAADLEKRVAKLEGEETDDNTDGD